MKHTVAVVTMATKFDRGMYAFLDSCERFGIIPVLLGYGLEWKGCCHKLDVVAHALDELRHHKKIVLFTDAYDSLFVDGLDAILDEYHKLDHPLIYSADRFCWPDAGKAELHPPSATDYRFLNAGGIIGEVDQVLESIECIRQHDWKWETIDQDLIMGSEMMRAGKIKMDTECRIFQTLYGSQQDLSFVDDRVVNTVTGSYPKIVHGNGRWDMRLFEGFVKWGRTPGYNY